MKLPIVWVKPSRSKKSELSLKLHPKYRRYYFQQRISRSLSVRKVFKQLLVFFVVVYIGKTGSSLKTSLSEHPHCLRIDLLSKLTVLLHQNDAGYPIFFNSVSILERAPHFIIHHRLWTFPNIK